MRLLSFRLAGALKYGAAVDSGIVDLSARLGDRWPSLRAAIAAKALDQLAAATKGQRADFKMEEVELLPVIPDPGKILCVGLNYSSHVGEMGRELPKVPSVFARLHDGIGRRRRRLAGAPVATKEPHGECARQGDRQTTNHNATTHASLSEPFGTH